MMGNGITKYTISHHGRAILFWIGKRYGFYACKDPRKARRDLRSVIRAVKKRDDAQYDGRAS